EPLSTSSNESAAGIMSTTTRDGRAVGIRVLLVVLFAVVLVLLAVTALFVRWSLPKLDGKLVVSGSTGPGTICRDARGTPHIEADTLNDVLFGEGFACAQDRLWQMDTLRRRAEGRLSEFAGTAALEPDRYMRVLGLGAAAEAAVRALDPQARAALESYAAG